MNYDFLSETLRTMSQATRSAKTVQKFTKWTKRPKMSEKSTFHTALGGTKLAYNSELSCICVATTLVWSQFCHQNKSRWLSLEPPLWWQQPYSKSMARGFTAVPGTTAGGPRAGKKMEAKAWRRPARAATVSSKKDQKTVLTILPATKPACLSLFSKQQPWWAWKIHKLPSLWGWEHPRVSHCTQRKRDLSQSGLHALQDVVTHCPPRGPSRAPAPAPLCRPRLRKARFSLLRLSAVLRKQVGSERIRERMNRSVHLAAHPANLRFAGARPHASNARARPTSSPSPQGTCMLVRRERTISAVWQKWWRYAKAGKVTVDAFGGGATFQTGRSGRKRSVSWDVGTDCTEA